MKKSSPRQETIHKYTLFLKSAIIKMANEGTGFSVKEFIRENKLPVLFISKCVELGYINKIGDKRNAKFYPIVDFHDVTEYHGEQIAKSILNYNMGKSEQYKNRKMKIKEKEEVCKTDSESYNLQYYSSKSLIDELKKRGYKGLLKREVIETIEF